MLARALSLNTCITSLDLNDTSVGAAGACVLFPALTQLTAMTYLNLSGTGLGSSGASHLCSALTHLTAMTKLNLSYNRLTADDGARICGAAAAAGMTRLEGLYLGVLLGDNGFTGSDVVGCGAWRQLNLPQPPDEIVRKCTDGYGRFACNFAPLVSYLLSDDKVSCHAIRIFVVGDSTVPPPPPPVLLVPCLPPHLSIDVCKRTLHALCLTRGCRRARRRWFARSCLPRARAPPYTSTTGPSASIVTTCSCCRSPQPRRRPHLCLRC